MTDEEKKAIDILINEIADIVISEYCTHCKICENEDTECYYTKVIDIVYNLVQKQSKEIEELKKYKEGYKLLSYSLDNYTSKDKIKAKIEEYEKELNKLLQKEEWLEPHDTIKRNKYMHYIEFGQSLLEKE